MPDVAVVMPKMSMTMTEGEVVSWRRQQGEAVRSGDVLVEVLTDKVEMEVEAPADGVLQRVVADVGARIPVGEPLAYITSETDALLGGLFDSPAGADGASADTATVDTATSAAPDHALRPVPPSRKSKIPALPGARRRAAELSVDLSSVSPTGPDGAVTVRDVEAAHAGPSAAPTAGAASASPEPTAADTPAAPPATTAPAASVPVASAAPPAGANGTADVGFADALATRRNQIREAVNTIMAPSAAIPQFTAWSRLELDAASRERGSLSWTTLLLSALAHGLREAGSVPEGVGIALAVDTPVGLLAPVLPDCDRPDLADLDAAMRGVVDRARRGRLGAGDIDGAVSTLSNLGSWGVQRFQALLTPPQASALSVGVVGQQPVVRHGAIGVALVCEVGLTVDHRVYDGADAARILQAAQAALSGEQAVAFAGVGGR